MRRLAALLVLLLVALLAWLVLTGDEPGGAPPGAPDAARRGGEPAEAGADAGDEPSAAPVRRREHTTVTPPAERAEPEPELTTYTVRVVDGEGRPVPGVPFTLADENGSAGQKRFTRSDGTVAWEIDAAAQGEREIVVSSPLLDPLTLREPETGVRLTDLLPLEIRFVDQETCRPLPVWITGSPLETDDVLSYGPRDTDRPQAAPVRPGRNADLRLWFDAPDGYVIGERRAGNPVVRDGVVSRYATSVRTTVPVARELRLRVTVLRHDGTPAEGARIGASVSGRVHLGTSVIADAGGDAAIEGLPFLRGERLYVHASDAPGLRSVSETALLVDPDREIALTLTLPEKEDDGNIGIGGGAGSSFSSRFRERRPKPGTGRLTLATTRRNGLPAAGARLIVSGPAHREGRTDDSGLAAFDGLPAGRYTVTLREPGLVATSEVVDLVDGEARTLALRETAGRAATVRVVDPDGLPLPNVELWIDLPWGERHVQVVDGVQDLDHWTDISGRCRFVDLPGETVHVHARLGSRTVGAGLATDTLELTMPNE